MDLEECVLMESDICETNYSKETEDFIAHHGTKGMHWGVRQYQNEDGSLTPMGRVRYGVGAARKSVNAAAASAANKLRRKLRPTLEEVNEDIAAARAKEAERKALSDAKKELKSLKDAEKAEKDLEKQEKQQAKQEKIDERARKRFEKGKSVDLNKISDEELNYQLNRLNTAKRYSDIQKQLNPEKEERNSPKTNTLKRQAWDAIKKNAAEGVGEALKNTIVTAGKRALMSEADRIKEEKDMYENRLKTKEAADKILNYGKKSESEKLKEAADTAKAQADRAKNLADTAQYKLMLQAYKGVPSAGTRLKEVNSYVGKNGGMNKGEVEKLIKKYMNGQA